MREDEIEEREREDKRSLGDERENGREMENCFKDYLNRYYLANSPFLACKPVVFTLITTIRAIKLF